MICVTKQPLNHKNKKRKEEKTMECNVKTSRYANIDILKCLCAFMVVCLHNALPMKGGGNNYHFIQGGSPCIFHGYGFLLFRCG